MRKILVIFLILFSVSLRGIDLFSSPFYPAAKSLIIPGWGFSGTDKDYYTMPSFVIEGIIVTYDVLSYFYERKEDGISKIMANRYSGASLSASDEEYWNAVEWYRSLDEYRVFLWDKARSLRVDDPASYVSEHDIPDSLSWEWVNDSLRIEYGYKRDNYREGKTRLFYGLVSLGTYHILNAVFTYFNFSVEVDPSKMEVSYTF